MEPRLFNELMAQAQARGDLGEARPVATMAGRVVRQGEDPAQALARFPQAELETGGMVRDALPGTIGAALAPTGNRTLQAAMATLDQQAPALMKRVRDFPAIINSYLMPKMPEADTVGMFRGLGSGKHGVGGITINANQNAPELASTLAHELTHADTAFTPRPTRLPSHQEETARQLAAMMPGVQQKEMARYVAVPGQQLRDAATGTPGQLKRRFETGQPAGLTPPTISRASPALAYNEAMSYLTESLLKPAGADPALEAVAKAMGRNIR